MESLILAAVDLSGVLDTVKNVGMVAIGLGFVIFVHELGHFLVAKACGVQVDKFYVGFDVPIPLGIFTIPGKLFHFHYGETEYGLGAIPLGGYVKMLGQDDNPQNAQEEAERTRLRDEQGNVRLNPRSYQAKSVPQRMAIISAGVIMNIIFGFLFAAIAYRNGVMIQPAVIGSTSPGDPAWKQNLLPGDRILQVGKESSKNEHMRFNKDMMLNFALYGSFDKDVDVLVRTRDGEEKWVQMRPSDRYRKSEISRPTLGIGPSEDVTFGSVPTARLPLLGPEVSQLTVDGKSGEVIDDYGDVQALMATHSTAVVRLKSRIGKGDKLVAIDDEPVRDYADVQRLLASRATKKIVLTIERAPKEVETGGASQNKDGTTGKQTPVPGERFTLELLPRPARDYGIEMESSPISAVQQGSPAEKAGLLPGDRLVSFAGEPIGDPLTFPQRTLDYIGQTVELEVERPEGKSQQTLKIPVELREPQQTVWASAATSVAVETMGIAYDVTTTVARIRDGSSASGQLQPGDQLVKVQFKTAGEAQREVEAAIFKKPEEVMKVDGKMVGWPSVVYLASTIRMPDSKLAVTVLRGGKEVEAELTSQASQDTFIEHRGLVLMLKELEEKHTAANWGEAFSLGAREMKERIAEVWTVVTRLVTGRFSLFNMGGPLSIIGMATNEADRGVSDLLMFFAFLSANLAVLNFLPIPALDGGHMVFLLYEAIRRKPVDENLQMKLSAAGILSLLALMLFVTLLDLQRWFL